MRLRRQDGMTMNTELYRIKYVWLLAILIAGFGTWLLAGFAGKTAESKPMRLPTTVTTDPAQAPTSATSSALDAAQIRSSQANQPVTLATTNAFAEAITPLETAPVDGLTIASQSWRRGGLGSNALVTFTLRNSNEYAVKDIELACAFSRRDGSHLTDRKRMIHDIVNMRSRKTFARLHVGFVNINADQAKCSLVGASHT
jgi:hypothetical protein